MNCKSLFAVAGVAAIVGSIAVAQPTTEKKPAQPATKPTAPASKDAKPSGQPEGMPPMTEQQMKDMQVCQEAGMPKAQHTELAKSVGTWTGKFKMWMGPDSKEPFMVSECSQTITSIMDGRFIKIDVKGDMGGHMYTGQGVCGFDNVSQKYVSTWCDNMGSGIMYGTGEASQGGKVITFNYNYNCPVTKKPAVMREVHTHSGPDAYTIESHAKDPHTGKEFKVMEIAFTRGAAPAARASN